jgi:hypothetical protein
MYGENQWSWNLDDESSVAGASRNFANAGFSEGRRVTRV